MAVKAPLRERIEERTDVWVADRAITFDEFLQAYEGNKDHVDLQKGVPTIRMAARIEHEKLFGWLHALMQVFAERHDLGIVLGSRTAVRISKYDGRLPDILFVCKQRLDILESLSLTSAPDLVIELISPGDRRSERLKLEADYRSIGVTEIVVVDSSQCRVTILHKSEPDYVIDELQSGVLRLESVPRFWLELDWLFDEPRPTVLNALARIEA